MYFISLYLFFYTDKSYVLRLKLFSFRTVQLFGNKLKILIDKTECLRATKVFDEKCLSVLCKLVMYKVFREQKMVENHCCRL
jgi:hypothetical protein